MKPNNAISECLLDVAKYVSDPEFDTHPDVPDEMIDYAAKLNLLVEAARDVVDLAPVGGKCRCQRCFRSEKLYTALRNIELPGEANV